MIFEVKHFFYIQIHYIDFSQKEFIQISLVKIKRKYFKLF